MRIFFFPRRFEILVNGLQRINYYGGKPVDRYADNYCSYRRSYDTRGLAHNTIVLCIVVKRCREGLERSSRRVTTTVGRQQTIHYYCITL